MFDNKICKMETRRNTLDILTPDVMISVLQFASLPYVECIKWKLSPQKIVTSTEFAPPLRWPVRQVW